MSKNTTTKPAAKTHYCSTCDRKRSVNAFYRFADGRVVPQCKDCRREYAATVRAAKRAEAEAEFTAAKKRMRAAADKTRAKKQAKKAA